MKQLLIIIISIISFSTYAETTTQVIPVNSSLKLIIGDDARNLSVIEKYSRFLTFPSYGLDGFGEKKYLVQQDFEQGWNGLRHTPAKITVSSKEINMTTRKIDEKTVWSFTAEGVFGKQADYPFGSLYQVGTPGCCDELTINKFYSLLNGEFVMSTTTDPIKISIANTKKHAYVGIETNCASSRIGDKKSAATIFYGHDNGTLQKVSVFLPELDINCWDVTSLKFSDLKNESQDLILFDEEDFDKITVNIELLCHCDSSGFTINIPIKGNKLDISSAKISGFDGVLLKEI